MKRFWCLLIACLMLLTLSFSASAEGSRDALLRGVMELSPEERAAFIEDLSTACQQIGESAVPRREGAGYDSPEEALAAWLEAIRDGDSTRAVSCYAIESLMDHLTMDVIRQGRGLPFLATETAFCISVPDPLYRDANVSMRVHACYSAVLQAMRALRADGESWSLESELVLLYNYYYPEDRVNALLDELPMDISDLAKLDNFVPREELPDVDPDAVERQTALIAACYGAEDAAPVSMGFTSARGPGTVTTYAIEYAGRWYLFWPSRDLVGTNIGLSGYTGIQLEES